MFLLLKQCKWIYLLGHRVHPQIVQVISFKKTMFINEISEMFEELLSSNKGFDLDSNTDLDESDSADDDIDNDLKNNNIAKGADVYWGLIIKGSQTCAMKNMENQLQKLYIHFCSVQESVRT